MSKPLLATNWPATPAIMAMIRVSTGAQRRSDNRAAVTRAGQQERREHRRGEEEELAPRVGGQVRGLDHQLRLTYSSAVAMTIAAASRPPRLRIHLLGDEQAGQGVDDRAEYAHEMGRAPQRHVEAEEAMPEVVDGSGEHGDGAPRRQMKAPRAAQPSTRIVPGRVPSPSPMPAFPRTGGQ
jgi:hypothetical protein